MYSQGTVVDPSSLSNADATVSTLNFGRQNDAIVSGLHARYYTQAYRQNIYYGSTASAGVTIAIASTLTPTFSIWNPAGSGKLCVPLACLIGWTATTAALGTFVWTSTTNAGSGISTTAPFVAFGTGTPVNANLGGTKTSSMRFAGGGTTTLVAAASFFRTTGLSITATTAATSVAPGWLWKDDFEGACILQPSTAIHLMGSTAIATTVTVSLVWMEVPV